MLEVFLLALLMFGLGVAVGFGWRARISAVRRRRAKERLTGCKDAGRIELEA
jgi:hypothetical protein